MQHLKSQKKEMLFVSHALQDMIVLIRQSLLSHVPLENIHLREHSLAQLVQPEISVLRLLLKSMLALQGFIKI